MIGAVISAKLKEFHLVLVDCLLLMLNVASGRLLAQLKYFHA